MRSVWAAASRVCRRSSKNTVCSPFHLLLAAGPVATQIVIDRAACAMTTLRPNVGLTVPTILLAATSLTTTQGASCTDEQLQGLSRCVQLMA